MPKKDNLTTGTLGEKIAYQYLTSRGYKIIEKNFHKRYTEIDIVALDGQTVVFVEVKTRRGNLYGSGEEAITPWKLKTLKRSAQYYMLLHPRLSSSIRIDIVSINLSCENKVEKINLYKNITL
jgi:putative endonuclease